jgi:hydroxyacylglutathione hydrolase
MFLRQIQDLGLAQNAYLIGCQRTGQAIVIDPERDVDRYITLAAAEGLRIVAVADTHIHADYLSGARELVEQHGAKAYLSSEGGKDWQFDWALNHPQVQLVRGGESFPIGNIEFKVLHTPGHTPEHISLLVTDHGGGATEPMALLSGDFIFVGDVGRPDLLESAAGAAGAMEPSARQLFQSLRASEELPEFLQILPGHGAGSACGKALGALPSSVLGYERRFNAALSLALSGAEDHFVQDILSGQPEPPLYFARMKRENKAGPSLLPNGRLPQPRQLTGKQLAQQLAAGTLPLDLRQSRAEFMKGHLKGSLYAPLAGGKFSIVAGSYAQPEQSFLLVVNTASEVEAAVRQLVRIGLDQIVGWTLVEDALGVSTNLLSSIPRVSTAALCETAAGDTEAYVLDVRSLGEHTESSVPAAQHIAYTRLAARLDDLPRSQRIYVHCGSGLRSSLAAPFLARAGWDVVHVDGDFADIPCAQ